MIHNIRHCTNPNRTYTSMPKYPCFYAKVSLLLCPLNLYFDGGGVLANTDSGVTLIP